MCMHAEPAGLAQVAPALRLAHLPALQWRQLYPAALPMPWPLSPPAADRHVVDVKGPFTLGPDNYKYGMHAIFEASCRQACTA